MQAELRDQIVAVAPLQVIYYIRRQGAYLTQIFIICLPLSLRLAMALQDHSAMHFRVAQSSRTCSDATELNIFQAPGGYIAMERCRSVDGSSSEMSRVWTGSMK